MVSKLSDALRRCHLEQTRLVVAVSGGPDSLALLLGLKEVRDAFALGLHVAHFDHRLRPDGAADAAFVEDLARALGLPVTVGRGDVRRTADEQRLGVEEAARRERYHFLAHLQRAIHAKGVLVAHTQDDQTETRLLHLVRGTGLRGLAGMVEDAVIDLPGTGPFRLIRPLLNVRRGDTEAFCGEHGVTARLDPSNLDRAFTRNRVRHEIVPRLRAINPGLDAGLARLARCALDAEEFLDRELERRLPDLAQRDDDGWVVRRSAWNGLPSALKRGLLRRAASALALTTGGLGADNVEQGMHAADAWPAGKTLTWPGGVELCVEHDRIVVRRRQAVIPPLGKREALLSIEPRELLLSSEQCVELAGISSSLDGRLPAEAAVKPIVRVRRTGAPCGDRRGDRWHCDLDGAMLAEASSLVVRARQSGDWIFPEGMVGRKKLQDVLVDAHVPRAERDGVPVVAGPSGIAWIVGVRRDRRFLAAANCPDVICLSVDGLGSRGRAAAVSPQETACAT
ncbi:MAG TPA: tRNA lysidine(34) synthetase TilS [Chloroflexota bacterium]|nr:tRNA lysidine(34) synthetase TilS [Chloroflexota bacterium]